jgi:hypothetical protein
LNNFHGSHIRALKAVYPEINIQRESFAPRKVSSISRSMKRNFWDNFAKEQGFSPSDAESWYKVTRKAVLRKKFARRMMHDYQGSHIDALVDVYPELKLKESVFKAVQSTSLAVIPSILILYYRGVTTMVKFHTKKAILHISCAIKRFLYPRY